jgi:S1-C subfamily serine protease
MNRWLEKRADQPHFNISSNSGIVPAAYDPGESSPVDFRLAAKKILPSVVSVDRYEARRDFFGDPSGTITETGTGSGVIISENGLIVTNNHVVANAAEVQVRLQNKKSYQAKVLGTDPRFDIAVIKIEASGLPAAELGDSKNLEVGQWVVAVGNPLGFDQTVSVGVVSSLGRALGVEQGYLTDAIQTDAAINPGNSGGALADRSGRLIGINSAIASTSGGSIGIGFAIPINRVKNIAEQIVKNGYATSAGIGISYSQRMVGILQFEDARNQVRDIVGSTPPDYGILVQRVDPNAAAGKAGLQPWDILLEIDGTKTDTPLALNQTLNNKSPGDMVTLKYWSKGETKTAKVALTPIRDDQPQ